MKKYILLIMFVMLSCLVFAEQNVTCGSVLVNSGVYTLNATGTSVNDCIDIFGSNIELDCRGNIITYGTNGGNEDEK